MAFKRKKKKEKAEKTLRERAEEADELIEESNSDCPDSLMVEQKSSKFQDESSNLSQGV